MTQPPDEKRIRQAELLISNILRGGVTISLLLIVTGLCVSFSRHRSFLSDPKQLSTLTRPGDPMPTSLKDVWQETAAGKGRGIIALGLVVLIATPVLRVAVSILTFVYEKDPIFVVITTVVLSLLIASFLLGKAGG